MEINKSQKNYALTAGIAGGIGGAVYGLKHPGQNAVDKISKLRPTSVETFTGYRNSLNISNATKAVAEGKLDLATYNVVKNIADIFEKVIEKEQAIVDIQNTPYNQRTKSFRQALKEANSVRPKMYKALLKLNKNLQDKLSEAGAFDAKKMQETTSLAKTKMAKMYKYLAGGIAKGAAVGLAAGALIGLGIHSIVKKD